ncbi:DUF6083 domain-containing protein [Streptomyces sp. NPDC053780]|uniref:DUF6083 domain-containing protein n=1 Tax=unclassified Streptomyces TaxID=2593676 RepID=UPI0034485081
MQCKPDVRRAYTGRHVLLEPDGLIPAPLVPPGHRWRVDSDGIAWAPALDEPAPGTACRVPHLIACSGRGDPGGCADARIQPMRAKLGKLLRAEPIAQQMVQDKVRTRGVFTDLERE